MGLVPIQKQVVFLSFGDVEQTANGNRYLVGQTDEGEVVIWLKPGADARLSWLLSQPLPLAAAVECLPDTHSAGRYWVPEKADILPLEGGPSVTSGLRAVG